jgi:hypothetical protein
MAEKNVLNECVTAQKKTQLDLGKRHFYIDIKDVGDASMCSIPKGGKRATVFLGANRRLFMLSTQKERSLVGNFGRYGGDSTTSSTAEMDVIDVTTW